MVGSVKELGCWSPSQAVKLSWSEGDNWRAEVTMKASSSPFRVEYKAIVMDFETPEYEKAVWEEGENRVAVLHELDLLGRRFVCPRDRAISPIRN